MYDAAMLHKNVNYFYTLIKVKRTFLTESFQLIKKRYLVPSFLVSRQVFMISDFWTSFSELSFARTNFWEKIFFLIVNFTFRHVN